MATPAAAQSPETGMKLAAVVKLGAEPADSADDPAPAPDPEPTPMLEPVPEPTPESAPGPEPEPAPQPEPAPEPPPAPAPPPPSRAPAPPPQIERAIPPSPDAPATLTLNGSGVTQRLAPGCVPSLADDFIDNGSWNNRRLMPRDCLLASTNPPVFSWRQPADRDKTKAWSFTLRPANAGLPATHLSAPSPRLALHAALKPGTYEWQVAYTSTTGQVVSSQPRRFAVSTSTPVVLFPDGEAIASQVSARLHPRVLPQGYSFASLAAMASSSDLAAGYTRLLRTAKNALLAPLPSTSSDPAFSRDAFSMLSKIEMTALRRTVDKEKKFIQALGYAFHFTGQREYLEAGIQRALNVASWPVDGATSEANFDYGNRAAYWSLALAVDLFSGHLDADQLQALVVPLSLRLGQAIERFQELDDAPFNSHVDGIAWTVLESLLYTAGTPGFEQGSIWLKQTWDMLQTTANAWGADDGGFGNGVSYAWYRMDLISQSLAAIRVIAGVDFARHPSVNGLGDYLAAFTAPLGEHMAAFGDAAEKTTHYNSFAINDFRLFSRLTRSPEQTWYWQYGLEHGELSDNMSPWHFMVQALEPLATARAPSADSSVFQDAGVTAIHSKAATHERSSVFFRSSEFGSMTHSFADQNAFTFVSRGKDLLISGGYYPYFGSPHHRTVTRATRYKNALTFDGGVGQAESGRGDITAPGQPLYSRDARGDLINHADTGVWAASTGDATLAYRSFDTSTRQWVPLLSEAVRTVAYNRKERVLLVYDAAASEKARQWELNFNALTPFATSGKTASVTHENASACIKVYGPAGAFTATSGFAVPPENGSPDQYQARYTVSTKKTQLTTLTVIREDCRPVPVEVTIKGNAISVSINGAKQIYFDRRTVVLP